ncbi:hypothetical protein G6F57_006377 [Rhizopus arrhizus]|uniref:SEC7 domain-containing protein n=1 Tax=Rhizopus oryzae TaxID=64495 RepID=A0A9P6XJZ3_RHIOR|nr:hypothetical protein G6F23_005147 [Rhizopus arrhizus]KAG1425013.1 hypothetical protein G6F58_002109 [Rhizopus delemar]KAG0770517.1 hypothetical protein G6F24_000123 [Rhizopus arrhizus]KAG0792609.1 hypothetical protein G6F21_004231 [Rhizopus arrhizus]KAG0800590.1 hypothetical protein G6F22_002079 [Rhizopus arrhizus]
MTPNSRLIVPQHQQRKRSNSFDISSNKPDDIKRGFISRLLPNTKVNVEHSSIYEYKASSTGNLNGHSKHGSIGKLLKRIGGAKTDDYLLDNSEDDDLPHIRPIRQPKHHSKIPLAPPPITYHPRTNNPHQFLSDLPDQYLSKYPNTRKSDMIRSKSLTTMDDESIYSTFTNKDQISLESLDSFNTVQESIDDSDDDTFVDADGFSQEDLELLEKKMVTDHTLAKRLSGGHFGSAGGLVASIQPEKLKIPADDELGQSLLNWKRQSDHRLSHLIRTSLVIEQDYQNISEEEVENDKTVVRKEAEKMLNGEVKQEKLFTNDVWITHHNISLSEIPQVNNNEEQVEESKETEEEEEEKKAKEIGRSLWKGQEESKIVSKERMAEWLGQDKRLNSLVLTYYMQCFTFSDMRLDAAFRKLCSKLYFKAEAQQIDRILEAFAHQYWDCNKSCLLGSADVVYAVVYSLLLLNTDLHVAQGKHVRMTRSEFWEAEVEQYLKEMYSSVKQFQILQPLTRKTNLVKRNSILGNPRVVGLKKSVNSMIRKSGIIDHNISEELLLVQPRSEYVANDELSLHYKEGVVTRKHLLENASQKAKHREWKECYLEVKNGELWMYQEEQQQQQLQVPQDLLKRPHVAQFNNKYAFTGKIPLNHTLSNPLPPPGYNRQRPHVFAIQQSDGGVYLFQTTSVKETQEWVSVCNYWAARISKEPLSGGVSNMEYGWGDSNGMIHDWMPPTATMVSSQLCEKEQYQVLQNYLNELNNEINDHRDKKTKLLIKFPVKSNNYQKVMANWEARAKYLLHEIIKYQNYCDALEKNMPNDDVVEEEEEEEKLLITAEEEKLIYQTTQVDLFKEINQELHFNL